MNNVTWCVLIVSGLLATLGLCTCVVSLERTDQETQRVCLQTGGSIIHGSCMKEGR